MKKINKIKQLALLLGGSAAATGAASQMTNATAHASTRTTKVVVKKGDTAWKIAKKNKTSLKKLVKENNLQNNGDLIYVGQKLNVKKGNKFKADLDAKKTKSAKTKAVTQTAATKKSGLGQVTVAEAATRTTTTPTSTSSTTPTTSSTTKSTASNYTSNASGSEKAAKEWIASRESSGSYSAQNGRYYGRYQLDVSYLKGDLSAANQEKVADNYVKSRYGSWSAAQNFWQSHGWY